MPPTVTGGRRYFDLTESMQYAMLDLFGNPFSARAGAAAIGNVSTDWMAAPACSATWGLPPQLY
jgi:hypothetical protein